MESKKINQLATELAPDLSDITIIGDPTTGISKKITLSQMASLFTGTVEEYANFAAFPLVGVADTIYIAKDTNVIYRWDSTAYVVLSPNVIASLVFNDANGFDGTIALVGSVATLTITTALTSGSVPFIGASGALTQDNANLFFDDTNNRLGIATASPTTPLDVFGSGIIGRLNATSTNNAYLGFASNGTNKWSAGNVQSDHRFRIFSEANSAELITILQTGEFGIGIANPLTKLHIDGGATALIANLDANVSVAKTLSFRSDNSNRINLEVSGTESGSNAGANFFIRRYSDAGSLIDTPLTITRSTGAITLATTLNGIGAIFSNSVNSINPTSNTINLTVDTGYNFKGFNGYWGFRTGTAFDFNLDTYNANTQLNVLKIDQTGIVTLIAALNGTSAAFSTTANIGSTYRTNAQWTTNLMVKSTTNGIVLEAPSTSDNALVFRHDGTNGVIRTTYFSSGAHTPLILQTSDTNRLTIGVNGEAKFSNGIAISNATATTGGIQFPATAVDIADANNLDDYEEGTWTAGFTFGGGNVGLVMSQSTGKYTKIGRKVTCIGYIALSNKGSSAGFVRLTGLPFTIFNNLANYAAISMYFGDITYTGQLIGYGVTNTSQIDIGSTSEAGVFTQSTHSNFANTTEIILSFTYFVN